MPSSSSSAVQLRAEGLRCDAERRQQTMSDTYTEGAINRHTAATLALAEAQYRVSIAEREQHALRAPEDHVRQDFDKWLRYVLDGEMP